MLFKKREKSIEELRQALEENNWAMAIGAGIQEALIENVDIDKASDDEIRRLAKERGRCCRTKGYVV